jgi:hypothetical protein
VHRSCTACSFHEWQEKQARAAKRASKGAGLAIPKTFTQMPRDPLACDDGSEWQDRGSAIRCRMIHFMKHKMWHLEFTGKPIAKHDRISLEFKLAAVVSFLFLYLYHLYFISTSVASQPLGNDSASST